MCVCVYLLSCVGVRLYYAWLMAVWRFTLFRLCLIVVSMVVFLFFFRMLLQVLQSLYRLVTKGQQLRVCLCVVFALWLTSLCGYRDVLWPCFRRWHQFAEKLISTRCTVNRTAFVVNLPPGCIVDSRLTPSCATRTIVT